MPSSPQTLGTSWGEWKWPCEARVPSVTWGLIYYAISSFFFAMMVLTVKLLVQTGLPVWTPMFVRSMILAGISLLELNRHGESYLGERRALLCLRGVLGTMSVAFLFLATKFLPLADTTVFSFLSPVIAACLAPYLLKESSRGAWYGITGCLVGVLLILQPGFIFGKARLSDIGVLVGFVHSTASATAKMCVRALKAECRHVIMLYQAVFAAALSGSVLLYTNEALIAVSFYQVLLLLACGAVGYAVQLYMTIALELAPAAQAMTMSYTTIIWSELAGVLLFNEGQNVWAVLGVILVIGSSLMTTLQSTQEYGRAITVEMENSYSSQSERRILIDKQDSSETNESTL